MKEGRKRVCVPLLGLSFSDVKRIFVTSWILEGKKQKKLASPVIHLAFTSYIICFKQNFYTILYYFIFNF